MTTRPYPSFLIYRDAKKEYRWKLQASNIKVIADSGEGYVNRAGCIHGISLVVGMNSNTPIWQNEDAQV